MIADSGLPHCPLCESVCPVRFVTRDVNRRVSDRQFSYHRCESCALMFLNDPPDDLARYYPPDYVSLPRSIAQLKRIAGRAQYQIEMVRCFVTCGRLLEIGPGYGSFAWLAKTAGFDVDVIEMDTKACEYLERQLGVTVIQSASPEQVLKAESIGYDAIVMWHSIEHLPDAWETLRYAARVLNPGGIILVATPNPAAWQFGVMGGHWPHVDAPRHLWLIPLTALEGYLTTLDMTLAFATSSDPGARNWNRFGWSQLVLNQQPDAIRKTVVARVASRGVGAAIAAAARRWENRNLKGSAYSAVFQKRTASR